MYSYWSFDWTCIWNLKLEFCLNLEFKIENRKKKKRNYENITWAEISVSGPSSPFRAFTAPAGLKSTPPAHLRPFSFSFSLCHRQVGPPGQLYLPRHQPTRPELLLYRKPDSVRNKPPRIGRVIVAPCGSLASVDQTERPKSSPTMALNRTWSRGIRTSALASPMFSAWPSGPLDAATIPSARCTPSLASPRVRGISASLPRKISRFSMPLDCHELLRSCAASGRTWGITGPWQLGLRCVAPIGRLTMWMACVNWNQEVGGRSACNSSPVLVLDCIPAVPRGQLRRSSFSVTNRLLDVPYPLPFV
jgi:hypothetical protein